MRSRTVALAWGIVSLWATSTHGFGVGPTAKIQHRSTIATTTCGADPCCWQLTDADSNGDFGDDWQGAYNAMRALGATCSSYYRFLPPIAAGPHDLLTEVRICNSASPGVGEAAPTCTAGAGHPTIQLRGLWHTPRHVLRCKATAGGSQPEGCIWAGNAYTEGTLTSVVPFDIPVASAPYLEQYTNSPTGLTPFDTPVPFLGDGISGTVSLRVKPSSRTDIAAPRLYRPPYLVGTNTTLNLFSDARDSTMTDGMSQWVNSATLLGTGWTLLGDIRDLVPQLGEAALAVGYYRGAGATVCAWSASATQALSCSATLGPPLNIYNTGDISQESAGFEVSDWTSLTINGNIDASTGLTYKTLIEANTATSVPRFGSITVGPAAQLVGNPNSLNATLKLTNGSASPGTVTINGTVTTLAGPKNDVMGLICTPQTYAAGRTIPLALGATAKNGRSVGGLVSLSYYNESMPCALSSAPGLSTGSVAVGTQGAVASTRCIDLTTGILSACTVESTKLYPSAASVLAGHTLTLTSDVTGGKTCSIHTWVNGAPAICGPGCTATKDANGAVPYAYGGASLLTSGQAITNWVYDWVPAGGYVQLVVDGSGSCSLTGSFTFGWTIYPNL